MGKVPNVEEFASLMGCKVGKLQPFGKDNISQRVLDSLWLKILSCSLSIYFISILLIPKVVALRLEKIQQDFLWSSS